MDIKRKVVVWLKGEVKTPPFSKEARIEAGCLLCELQNGYKLSLPQSRPMPSIGRRCHELRIVDTNSIWRIIYRVDLDAVIVADVFKKKAMQTPKRVIDDSKRRLRFFDSLN